jgi:hypothetical protein
MNQKPIAQAIADMFGSGNAPAPGLDVDGKVVKTASRISFDCDENEKHWAGMCVTRIIDMAKTHGVNIDHMTMSMDLLACHCNGTPLKLMQLYMSAPDDFTHDMLGIARHINRHTGQLMGGFKPRFAVTKQ